MVATEGIGLLAPTAVPAIRAKALLYSYGAIAPEYEPLLIERIGQVDPPVDIVGRLIGSEYSHPSIYEAIDLAKRFEASVVLLPNDSALGVLGYPALLEDIVPGLAKSGLRIRAVAPFFFDSEDPRFLAGIRWADESLRLVKAAKRKKKFPPCRCHHRVVKPGREGHNLIGGLIGPCHAKSCSCPEYEPMNEPLMAH